MSYEFLPEVAMADAAFRATGATLEELFLSAAEAVMVVMIENLDAIEPRIKRHIHLQNEALDLLLFDFLQEFIFHKDAQGLLLRAMCVEIARRDGVYVLEADACGELIDRERHTQGVDVKAVTLHKFEVKQGSDGWSAHVILDV